MLSEFSFNMSVRCILLIALTDFFRLQELHNVVFFTSKKYILFDRDARRHSPPIQ